MEEESAIKRLLDQDYRHSQIKVMTPISRNTGKVKNILR